jgi:hypothetical protein
MPEVELPALAELKATLPEAFAFWSWQASYGNADSHEWDIVLGQGGTIVDPDMSRPTNATPIPELTMAEFSGPPTGDWVLQFSIAFAGDGDAIYYWHVRVP